jgi:LuxR family maltose regulon positive regulatory protein
VAVVEETDGGSGGAGGASPATAWRDPTLRRPELRDGLVARSRLVARLVASRDVPVVVVAAGPGYGKTTLLAQWAGRDDRAFAWLSLSPRHTDPALLLADLALALDAVEPLGERAVGGLRTADADITGVRLPGLARAIRARSRPFVLVLDNVHHVATPRALAAIETLCASVPDGSQVALAGRRVPDLPLGAMRVAQELVVLGASDLAMSVDEGTSLLGRAGLELGRADAELLVERTEGWPAALYLAALALRDDADPAAAACRFGGRDRVVVDYLRDEVMRALPAADAEFLTRTSILDVLSGPLCDAVLVRSGSAGVLERLERSNLLVVPLDRTRERFRYHRLLRDKLRARLRRLEPALEPVLHARASRWFEASGDSGRAIEHASESGDAARFDALVWSAAQSCVATGRAATVLAWLAHLPGSEIATRPALVVTAAWGAFTTGDMRGFDAWALVAEKVAPASSLPDGTPFAGAVALLRALRGRHGVGHIREEAAQAYELHPRSSPLRVVACLLQGVALRLQDEHDAARERLEEGAAVGQVLNPAARAHCLSQLALLEIDAGAWAAADRQVEETMTLVEQLDLQERPALADAYAAEALVCAHRGDTSRAGRAAKHAVWLLSMLDPMQWLGADARVVLARAMLLLGDVAMSRLLCREAESLLAQVSDAGNLPQRLVVVGRAVDAEGVPLGVGNAVMTPAEMRVLRYLPTHLSFAAIADELFVSRNTVKTQAIAIYRKLGVSSRTPAVAAARELGVLEV